MPSPELSSEAEVAELVTTFYAKVRDAAILGPVFERYVADWSRQMPKMIALRWAALCGSKNYRGNSMLVHRVLPDLTDSMFERWRDRFHEAARALPNRAMAERAGKLSQRIAQSLWYDLQLQREPGRMPASLSRRSPMPLLAVVPE